VIREAASVILLRRTAGATSGFEVFFVRRHRGSSFMASAYVFPGGAGEAGEDARTTAARELFEEAGVLLARSDEAFGGETLDVRSQESMRKHVLGGGSAVDILAQSGLAFATDSLVPWAHWITPSIEPKRFSARFFVVEMPAMQKPSFDKTETVDQLWISPQEGIARAGELQLPPPQVRTLWELCEHTTIRSVLAAGRERAKEPHPIMPRLAPGNVPCLLLPWDPEYLTAGTGESTPLTYHPSWARGPSRFVMEDKTWKHVSAPGSPNAG
jgi:8-oxo-dGTP pyrophosphatase MutT (NUDIX family)